MASLSRVSALGLSTALRAASMSSGAASSRLALRAMSSQAATHHDMPTVHVPGGATIGVPENAFTPSKMPLGGLRTLWGLSEWPGGSCGVGYYDISRVLSRSVRPWAYWLC